MELLPDLLKLAHIGIAFALVAGIVSRRLLLDRAARSESVEDAHRLTDAAAPFERLVIWSSAAVLVAGLLTAWAQGYEWLGLTTGWMLLSFILVLSIGPLIPLVFVPRGRVFEAALAAARRQGVVTPELRAAFADRAVAFARRWEAIVIGLVIALMVLKPF